VRSAGRRRVAAPDDLSIAHHDRADRWIRGGCGPRPGAPRPAPRASMPRRRAAGRPGSVFEPPAVSPRGFGAVVIE
jgi:hypothetical protein